MLQDINVYMPGVVGVAMWCGGCGQLLLIVPQLSLQICNMLFRIL